MPLPAKLAAFGSVGAATAAAATVTWVVMTGGQPGSHKPSHEEQKAGSDAPLVCVGSDSVLRMPGSEDCPAGQRRFVLEEAETKVLECDDCDDPWRKKPPPPSNEGDPLADLRRRVGSLKKSPLFTVVDRGVPIFAVKPGSVVVYNGGGNAVAEMRATEEGGFFAGRSRDGDLAAIVGVSEPHAGLRITEGDVPRADLGKQEAANYSLRIASPAGGLIAGLGESQAGTGAIVVADQQSRVRASMTLNEGRGAFSTYTVGGAALASLRESQAGAGLFALGTAEGREAVKMTVNDNRYGVALAGPQIGFPLVTGSGLPGSYILGCSGGGSCRPY
jgi:hypothetical protein